jgi:hypothetical protein
MSKKNIAPVMGGSGSTLPKVIGILAGVALFVVVVRHPGDAASWVRGVGDWLGSVVDGLASFLRQLAR